MDARIVCQDGNILSNRLLLFLAFPILETPRAFFGESMETVVMLPDYTVEGLRREIKSFISGWEMEKLSTEDKIKRLPSTEIEKTEEIFVEPKLEPFELDGTGKNVTLNSRFECKFEECDAKLLNKKCLKQQKK